MWYHVTTEGWDAVGCWGIGSRGDMGILMADSHGCVAEANAIL